MVKKCGIILFDEKIKKYFLVYGRKSGKWGFPKGHMERGETEEDTALREFFEETGYRFSSTINLKEKYIVKNNIYFKVNIKNSNDLVQVGNSIPDNNEIEKTQWFFLSEILDMNIQKLNFGLKTWILNKNFKENNNFL